MLVGLLVAKYLSYLAILIFAVVSTIKVLRYATMPLHLRWELYPVPHEEGGLPKELKEMFTEMLTMKRIFDNKRRLWYLSYAFHGGIYLILIWAVLLLISGFSDLIAPGSLPGGYQCLIAVVGGLGMISMVIGTLALLAQRFDEEYKVYNAPVDYLNPLFAFIVALTGLLSWILFDPMLVSPREYVSSLISFGNPPDVVVSNPLIVLHLALLEIFVAYVPFTRMLHFFGKYFTYHKVMWDTKPRLVGRIDYEVTWEQDKGKRWRDLYE